MITYAQMPVGVMYASGNGVKRDYNQAEYWLKNPLKAEMKIIRRKNY